MPAADIPHDELMKLLATGEAKFMDPAAPAGAALDPHNEHYREFKFAIDGDSFKIDIIPPQPPFTAVPAPDPLAIKTIMGNDLKERLEQLGLTDGVHFTFTPGEGSLSITPEGRQTLAAKLNQAPQPRSRIEPASYIGLCNLIIAANKEECKNELKENILKNKHPLIGFHVNTDGSAHLFLRGDARVAGLRRVQLQKLLNTATGASIAFGTNAADLESIGCPSKLSIMLSKEEYQQLRQTCGLAPKPRTEASSDQVTLFSADTLGKLKGAATAGGLEWQPANPAVADADNDTIKVKIDDTNSITLDKANNKIDSDSDSDAALDAIASMYEALKPKVAIVDIKHDTNDKDTLTKLARKLIDKGLSFKVGSTAGAATPVTQDDIVNALTTDEKAKYDKIQEEMTAPAPPPPRPR